MAGPATTIPRTCPIKKEIAIAEGKRSYDKRDDIKKREMEKDAKRGMTRKVL